MVPLKDVYYNISVYYTQLNMVP